MFMPEKLRPELPGRKGVCVNICVNIAEHEWTTALGIQDTVISPTGI